MKKDLDLIHNAKFWKANIKEDITFFDGHFNRFEFDKHVHEEYTITLVQDGNMKAFLDGFSHSFNESAILTINPDEVHACKTEHEEGYKYNSIYFKQSLVEELCEGKKDIFFSKSVLENKEIYRKLTSIVSKDEKKQISQLELECELIEVMKSIVNLNTNFNTNTSSLTPHDCLIKKAKEYINDNFSLNLTLDDISKELSVSKYHFLRLFKEKTYLSPHNYLMLRRIEKAKQFLQKGDSIINTAYECGFNDQSHLHRRFKAITGLTPKNYQNFFN